MTRTALYAGTRNIYHDMVVAAKSLLYNGGADHVYFLTEDDDIQEPLPPCFTVMNVSNQSFFPPTGPNFRCRWTYMVMMRVALTKLFPQHDRMLVLDHDTIVRKPIDFLWEQDISNYYYAAVEEKHIRYRDRPYINFGVAMHNLAKLRADGTDDVIINSLNTVGFAYCEQDAVNSVCRRHILLLPQEYNAMFRMTFVPEDQIVIRHYAARSEPLYTNPDYQFYDAMPWNDVLTHMKGVKP